MELPIRICGILLVSCCAALMIRRNSPELSLLLSMAAVTLVIGAAAALFKPLTDLWEKSRELFGVGEVYLLPVVKCCAIALISRLTADLCREASQIAAASAVEFLGLLCALGAAMPLVGNMMSVIGEML
ncbi:MAG: stage III sporulation AC/AD family protein [Oscillospiraceae bacterium]|nr:stage III sporulation AC/AD family protein [Oscillospiraceae bacterium]